MVVWNVVELIFQYMKVCKMVLKSSKLIKLKTETSLKEKIEVGNIITLNSIIFSRQWTTFASFAERIWTVDKQ